MTEAFDMQLPAPTKWGLGRSAERSGAAFEAMEMVMIPAGRRRHQIAV